MKLLLSPPKFTTFEPVAIDSDGEISLNASSKVKSALKSSAYKEKVMEQKTISMNDNTIEAVASLIEITEADNQSNKDIHNKTLKADNKADNATSPTLRAAKSSLENGARYRILLFNENDVFITAIDGITGSVTPSFNLALPNKKYKWKAYSFNTTAAISPAIPSNPSEANFSITSTSTGGLLFDSGEVTTASSATVPSTVNILFRRQTSAIDIVMSGRGMFDRIIGMSGTANIATYPSGTFNLKTGKYTSYAAPNPSSGANYTSTVSSNNDTLRTLSLYTVNAESPITSYSVNLTSLTFMTDAYDRRKANRVFTNTQPFTFTKPFTPQLGKRYKILIDFLVTHQNITNSGGNVDWAYYNLFYNDTTKVYGLRHFNGNFYDRGQAAYGAGFSGEYFNWKAAKPGFNQAPGVLDPCTRVYPAGR